MGWRYEIGMTFSGPVDSAELRHLRATNVISDHTLCYSDNEFPRVYRSYKDIARQLAPAEVEAEGDEDGRPSEFFLREGRADREIWSIGKPRTFPFTN